ncbi:NnrS family protein [Marinobacter zhanjiangensis]|uniref:Short-chain dehydrogenase n=1 Tax=Marinobacter zhanjiangensis TaxID=578215 RepID=A0ABQ3B4P3_9GAMM|nr:NnrS family protein [Marinobacter zhanjiangensis]GGY78077.1 short-chain dehydrogenase [Marinobacter zhanjiangensis]
MTSGKSSIHAFWLFFPAAALHAALVVPLSIHAVLSGSGWPPGLLGSGHGHELIFGFALALVAGYTLGPQPRFRVLALLALWLTARLSWLLAPESWFAGVLSPLFALALARYVVPRFSAAKKWRNKTAAPLILTICLLAPAFWLASSLHYRNGLFAPDPYQLMQSAILGLLLLMTFIGGRLIAPAVAGTLEKKGIPLTARVQPRIEGTLIILLALSITLSLAVVADAFTGLVLLMVASLILVRIARWKLWHCPERPDLLMLAAGYSWLAVGSAVTAWHLLTGRPAAPALHLIAVGALGTLSTGVMLRLAWQRAHRRFPPTWQALTVGLLTSAAAISRYLAGAMPFSEPGLLWSSAVLWSLAYLTVAGQLIMLRLPGMSGRK